MKFTRKKINKNEWHKKFAWLPTSVQDTDDKHTYVWMEKYMRKYQGNSFRRYSQKVWFKKKLAGDFEKKDTFADGVFIGGSGSTSTIVSGSGISASPPITYTFKYDGTDSGHITNVTADVATSDKDAQIDLDFGDEDFTVESYAKIKQQTDPRHNQW